MGGLRWRDRRKAKGELLKLPDPRWEGCVGGITVRQRVKCQRCTTRDGKAAPA